MSSALAIAGVTALLRDRLNDRIINHDVTSQVGNSVLVSVLPPDRVLTASGSQASQINLFLYHVVPNPGWRNEGLPSLDGAGFQRLSNPPLALDLHYLISTYADDDLGAEILLGYAMQLLHEFPVITRKMIATSFQVPPTAGIELPPALRAVADCGLADQLELLKITPQTLSIDELSKLWTATQSSLRPSAAYQVSVVLIQAEQPTRAPLPVLSRGQVDPVSKRDQGVLVEPSLIFAVPTLDSLLALSQQPVVRLDDVVVLGGHTLQGSKRSVLLINDRFDINQSVDEDLSSGMRDDEVRLAIPAASAGSFPVGLYQVSVLIDTTVESAVGPQPVTLQTNNLALMLAPWITTALPTSFSRDGANTVRFTLTLTPQLRKGQRASLLLGALEVLPLAFVAPTASLDFVITDAPVGVHFVRLRVDGIDSPIIDRSATPPAFFPQSIEIT